MAKKHPSATIANKCVRGQVNEATVADLPSTIEIDQKWRALLKGSKIRKLERMTYRLNHIHAAAMLHDAVKSLIFRDELRARVQKFADLTHAVLHADANAAGEGKSPTGEEDIEEDIEEDNNGDGGLVDRPEQQEQEAADSGEEQGKYLFD